ncbi:hypothetical protein ACFFX1_40535 [Dactylosporangium sucinum]|uniref:Uncharacterized protein n=1 Tax=Dactylosporangium sucinum TaxID=1424081 RepID=A0A917WNL2_9ACTN|nr:hypothetical protein [Dactylosporangium sucinum]GGM17499.1 hypothetical protein GCM10007977_018410 [Dactylosporangium sucinum]
MKPHRTDGVSLTFGLIFLGIVIVWLFNQAVSVNLNAGWIVAVGLILFGLLGLLGALRSDRPEKDKAKGDKAEATAPTSSGPKYDYDYDPDDLD